MSGWSKRLSINEAGGIMNIKTFEHDVPDYLIDRGYDYYLNKCVIDLEEFEPNYYTCLVEGTSDYEVIVEMDHNGEILYTECDCPHHVEVCKHIVAACYTIRDLMNQDNQINDKDNDDEESLKTLLMKQDKETLVDVFIQLISEDRDKQDSLFFRFNNQSDYENAEKFLMSAVYSIDNYEEPRQRDLDRLSQIVIDINYKIRQLIKDNQFIPALELSFLVFDTYSMLNYNFEHYDFYEEFFEAAETIKQIVKEVLKDNRSDQVKSVLDLLLNYYETTNNDGNKEELINILISFTVFPIYRDRIEQIIKVYFEDYFEGWLRAQLRIFQLNNEPDQIVKLTNLNLKYPSMREFMIQESLEKQEYHKVLELAIEGENQEHEESHNKSSWQRYQLIAYKALGDIEQQKRLLNQCFINGRFDLKKEIKELYSKQEWPQHIEYLINQIAKKNPRHYMIVQLAREEKIKHIVYTECLRNPSLIMNNYKILLPEYKEQMEDIFLAYYHENQANMNKRKHYRYITSIIWVYYTVYGLEQSMKLINDLKNNYKRRPALSEELEILVIKIENRPIRGDSYKVL